MNKKDIKTMRSRETIISYAIEMFGEKGYDNFTVNGLCKTYGISKGLFYHNFSGKDELYLKCVEICYRKLLEYLYTDSALPTLEPYIELRLRFFKNNPHLSRIFFESYVQNETSVFDEVKKIRNSLIDFNRLVYLNFLNTVELRSGVSKEDAIEYFDMMQKMFNSYYSSPAFRKEGLDFLETEHKRNFSKFLECVIFGIAEQKQ